jgi:hypothetical protein
LSTTPEDRLLALVGRAVKKEEAMRMRTSIGRKGAVAALASALLVSGLFVGVSYGGGGGITQPQVIELVTTGCGTNDNDPATECHVYRLKDTDGERSGEIFRFKVPLRDTDGNPVGRAYLECSGSKGTGQTCTLVLSLKPGPFTELGTIVSTGVNSLPPSAITGGSGAYLNVRGEITGQEGPDGFHLTLNLIP